MSIECLYNDKNTCLCVWEKERDVNVLWLACLEPFNQGTSLLMTCTETSLARVPAFRVKGQSLGAACWVLIYKMAVLTLSWEDGLMLPSLITPVTFRDDDSLWLSWEPPVDLLLPLTKWVSWGSLLQEPLPISPLYRRAPALLSQL